MAERPYAIRLNGAGTWTVWDRRDGTDAAGVPKAQIFHGPLEEAELVAAAKNRQLARSKP